MTFNRELAAAVLVEAVFTNDETACAKYDITTRTLRNYRQRLHDDPELSALFQTKKILFDKAWGDDLLKALRGAATFIFEASNTAREDPACKKNPEMIAAMAGALKLCADVHLTSKVLDARLANTDRPTNELPRQVPTEADYPN